MTEFDVNGVKDELNALRKKVEDIITTYKSDDMSTEKIIGRVAIVGSFGGVTRTTVLGSLVFAALYAPIVGLSKDQLTGILEDVVAEVVKLPSTAEAAKGYAEFNTKAKAAVVEQGPNFDLSKINMPLSPMPKMKQ